MAQTPGPGGWTMPVAPAPPEFLPILDIPGPGPQRRLTVLFRWLLLLPQFIVLWVLSVVAFFAAVIGWFAALFTAHLPGGIARYLADYVAYDTRVAAAATLLVDRYPPFSLRRQPDYPVQIELRPGRLNRAAVFFRLILMIPAAVVNSLLGTGWLALAFFIWLWVLVTGRLPRPVFEATAAFVRFRMRFDAYVLMLTSAYPKGLFGEEPQLTAPGAAAPDTSTPGFAAPGAAEPAASATRPLVLSGAGKGFLVAFLVLGLAGHVSSDFVSTDHHSSSAPPVTTPVR
ncbi:DUF4389 domain-containing protein [Kitasatospora sp. NBC_01287]|uniref:DUF4389 domain-containing protein n=1 Tax=Kitasatospora sp. NBC_01287 TaxID=2903573 RepID=UPI00224FC934|nr:DUF4389 domain-containing protein [Kitasatospora sp. NBC_01287]MCX4750877.1 DUF4389 domain-containing protein [Kitasatospora sp. NBC_01287]